MNSRLDIIDAELDTIIKNSSVKSQRKAIKSLVEFVLDIMNPTDDIVAVCMAYLRKQEQIPVDFLEKFKILVEKYDEDYLSILEEYEMDSTSEDKMLKAFTQARIMSGLLWATDPDAYTGLAEMIYEINAGWKNLAEMRKIVLETVQG